MDLFRNVFGGVSFDTLHSAFDALNTTARVARATHSASGPVAKKRKGSFARRCTDWEPDPDCPGRVRSYHYTKGWRYRRA
jgi:hypothetical protein